MLRSNWNAFIVLFEVSLYLFFVAVKLLINEGKLLGNIPLIQLLLVIIRIKGAETRGVNPNFLIVVTPRTLLETCELHTITPPPSPMA